MNFLPRDVACARAGHESDGMGDIRGISHRNQLGAGTSQDRAGMVLGMPAGAEERDAKRTRL